MGKKTRNTGMHKTYLVRLLAAKKNRFFMGEFAERNDVHVRNLRAIRDRRDITTGQVDGSPCATDSNDHCELERRITLNFANGAWESDDFEVGMIGCSYFFP